MLVHFFVNQLLSNPLRLCLIFYSFCQCIYLFAVTKIYVQKTLYIKSKKDE